jgi:hypothetical protein
MRRVPCGQQASIGSGARGLAGSLSRSARLNRLFAPSRSGPDFRPLGARLTRAAGTLPGRDRLAEGPGPGYGGAGTYSTWATNGSAQMRMTVATAESARTNRCRSAYAESKKADTPALSR